MDGPSFQEQYKGNHCWGCGADNEHGLRIKSYWAGDGETVCTWQPSEYHMGGPRDVLNGGIIATVIDCHCIFTAIAAAYREEGREIGDAPLLWFATGTLQIRYRRPTPIDQPLTLTSRIVETTDRRTNLECTLVSGGEECVTAEMVAVRVPSEWITPG